jgi:hypothetical protein
MLERTEINGITIFRKPSDFTNITAPATVADRGPKPPVLAARNIDLLKAAEASAVASAQASTISPQITCPAGKIDHDGCCIYPTGGKAQGNINYNIFNNCNPMNELQLVFATTTDFEAEYDLVLPDCAQLPSSGTLPHLPTEGVVVQFNCFSKDVGPEKNTGGMIQYIFYVQGQTITPHIQYVSRTPDGVDHDWAPNSFPDITLPNSNTLPAKYSLVLWLNTDQNGYVNNVLFVVEDNNGKTHLMGVPQQNIYPLRIIEFQTNIVSTNGHYVNFKIGSAGTLSYTSHAQMSGTPNQQLSVEGGSYPHCLGIGIGTCESSNANYGFLNFCSSSEKSAYTLSQSVEAK